MDLEARCIRNPAVGASPSSNDATLIRLRGSAQSHLVTSLTKIITRAPPQNPWPFTFMNNTAQKGLFMGPTAFAYLLWTLTRVYSGPDFLPDGIHGKSLLQWCRAYLGCGQDSIAFEPAPDDTRPLNVGIGSEFLSYRVVKAVVDEDLDAADEVINALSSAQIGDDDNEWLRGRAGTLALLRFLRTYLPAVAEKVRPLEQNLIQKMMENDKPWTFSGTQYLGPVHGDIGNLTQIILTDPSYAPQLEERLSKLLDMQFPSGGFPIRDPPRSDKELLVHVCHGAPGFIYSLLAIQKYFPDLRSRIDLAISKGREHVWEYGLLRKEPCMCHGITGNGLILEEGRRREHFMAYATEEMMQDAFAKAEYEPSDDPWGLLWGEASRAWGWMCYDTGDIVLPIYSDV